MNCPSGDFNGQGGVLAHAFYPGNNIHHRGNIHFDSSEHFSELDEGNRPYPKIVFFTICLHEIGHALGLAHQPDKNILYVMYKSIHSDKLRFAKHWKQSLNCKRFLGRNAETLKGFVVYKVIKERCYLYCGNTLDREMRVSALYCNDHCRKEYFNDNN